MVSVKYLRDSLLLVGLSVYRDVATPDQAAVEQYNIIYKLSGSAPYIQHPGFGISTDIPAGCTIEQAHVISRHGERFPTKGSGQAFRLVYDKLRSTGELHGDLAFLNDHEYFVTDESWYEKETSATNSEGTYAGLTNLERHGSAFRTRYNDIFDGKLVVFTTNSGRVHQSAQAFARGFLGPENDGDARFVVLSEDGSLGANSLTPRYGCDAFDDQANRNIIEEYDMSFLDAVVDRWKVDNPQLTVKAADVQHLFEYCAFEINVSGTLPICNLFTNEEYVRWAYLKDVEGYYSNGPGHNLTATIGAPFLDASLKLLQSDATGIWPSFTHDTDIEIYYSALGLLATAPLPTDRILFPNVYNHAVFVPQAARLYTEKYSCDNHHYVRFIVNDAVYPLAECQNGPGFSCSLPDYETYVNTRLDNLDYAAQCRANGPSHVTFFWDYSENAYLVPDIDQ